MEKNSIKQKNVILTISKMSINLIELTAKKPLP